MMEMQIMNTGGGHHLYLDRYSRPCTHEWEHTSIEFVSTEYKG